MLTRLRVGGITLALRSPRRSALIRPTPVERAFIVRSGADIVLDLEERPVPDITPDSLLFDSGGPWRVHARGRRYLYSVHERGPSGGATRGLEIDRSWRRGVLFSPPSPPADRLSSALSYPLGELLFTHRITASGGLVAHACGVNVGGKGVLFCGVSGAGKTTTARLWRKHYPGAQILSDDRMAVRYHRGRFWAWGTPWHGAGGFASSNGRPLGAVFFLEHAPWTTIRRMDIPAAAARLFARTFPPLWDPRAIHASLGACGRLAEGVPCYRLRFRPDQSAVAAVLETLASGTRRGHRIPAQAEESGLAQVIHDA